MIITLLSNCLHVNVYIDETAFRATNEFLVHIKCHRIAMTNSKSYMVSRLIKRSYIQLLGVSAMQLHCGLILA